jgi:uncharacterized membrane protein
LNPPEDFEGSIDISLQPLAQKLQSSQGNARFCQWHCEAWGRFEEKPGRNDDHQSPLTPAFAWPSVAFFTRLETESDWLMNPIVLILILVLILSLFGGGYGYRRGNNALAGGGGLIGLVLLILIVLFLMGRLWSGRSHRRVAEISDHVGICTGSAGVVAWGRARAVACRCRTRGEHTKIRKLRRNEQKSDGRGEAALLTAAANHGQFVDELQIPHRKIGPQTKNKERF